MPALVNEPSYDKCMEAITEDEWSKLCHPKGHAGIIYHQWFEIGDLWICWMCGKKTTDKAETEWQLEEKENDHD
jgi:hypothetical protein